MFSGYSNNTEILNTFGTVRPARLESVDQDLLNLDSDQFSVILDNKSDKPNLELHVYTPDGLYLTGDHNITYSIEKNDTTSNLVAYQHLSIDIPTVLNKLGITRGQYKVIYNLFDNVIGSYDGLKIGRAHV